VYKEISKKWGWRWEKSVIKEL